MSDFLKADDISQNYWL